MCVVEAEDCLAIYQSRVYVLRIVRIITRTAGHQNSEQGLATL